MFEGSSGSVVHGIAYSANLSIWVAVGAAGNGAAAGRIASSADGIVWTTRNSGFTGDGVAFGLGRFTAVGGWALRIHWSQVSMGFNGPVLGIQLVIPTSSL
jgi:hypothetical protein